MDDAMDSAFLETIPEEARDSFSTELTNLNSQPNTEPASETLFPAPEASSTYTVISNYILLHSEIKNCLDHPNRLLAVDSTWLDFAYENCLENDLTQTSVMRTCDFDAFPAYAFDFSDPYNFENGT